MSNLLYLFLPIIAQLISQLFRVKNTIDCTTGISIGLSLGVILWSTEPLAVNLFRIGLIAVGLLVSYLANRFIFTAEKKVSD